MSNRWVLDFSLAMLTMSFDAGCTEVASQKASYGHDYCDHCQMQITDKRFGGEILTKKGRTFKYDSLECLAHGQHTHRKDIEAILVVDFKTQELFPLGKMKLYRNENVRGPMGTQIQGLISEMSLPQVQLEDLSR